MNILTSAQEQFLNFLKRSELSNYFYFTGGTALSQFYLQHRYSYDLDFFTEKRYSLNINAILSFLKSLPNVNSVKFNKIYDRRMFFLNMSEQDLKVEFSLYPFKRISKVRTVDGLMIDSFDDLFINKLAALADRDEEKDLIDIYFIFQAKDIDYILWGIKKAKEKFQIDGVQYIIQKKMINVSDSLENVPYLIKPFKHYKEIFKKIATEIAKEYWNA